MLLVPDSAAEWAAGFAPWWSAASELVAIGCVSCKVSASIPVEGSHNLHEHAVLSAFVHALWGTREHSKRHSWRTRYMSVGCSCLPDRAIAGAGCQQRHIAPADESRAGHELRMTQAVAADLVSALPPPGQIVSGSRDPDPEQHRVWCRSHIYTASIWGDSQGRARRFTCMGLPGNTLTRALPSLSVLTSDPPSAETARDVIVAL